MGVRSIVRARPPMPFQTPTSPVGSRGFEAIEGTPKVHPDTRISWETLEAFGGIPATSGSPMSIPVFWDCLNLVSESIAALHLDVFKVDPDEIVLDELTAPPIIARPFPPWTRGRWLGFIIRCLLLRGNAFALLGDWDSDGYPRQAAPIAPDRMSVTLTEDGQVLYRINSAGPYHRMWPQGDIMHIGGYQLDDGPLGVGVLDYGLRTTELSYKTFDYMRDGFEGAGVPSGVLTVDEPEMTNERADSIWTRWVAAHSGPIRRPAVLPASMTFVPLSMNFTDADVATLRTLNDLDVCHLFAVPSWLVNVSMPGASTTYSNAEQQQSVFKTMTLTRWTSRIESVASSLLPGRTEVRFDWTEMLRSTTAEQYAAWTQAIETGILTINEVRKMMNRPPVKGGDTMGSVAQQTYVQQTAAYAGKQQQQGQALTPEEQNVA